MRPHLLRIEAFGPYADPLAISFDALSQEGLFLIHGSTGAGKTFLLDALCFALYGEVSGDRNVKGLKSDHAAPGAVPRVSLEFSSGGLRYAVERCPAYSAPKSRGGGMTDKPPTAVLFRLHEQQKLPLASRSTEVSREVERLVGLNATQFRQVILLPQGKFAEVLRARAEERETLLKTLFHTVVFERAGQWLEEQTREARHALAEACRGQEVLRQQAAQEWSPYQSEEEPGSLPADQADLDAMERRIQLVCDAAAIRLQHTTAALEATQRLKKETDLQQDRWSRRASAAARLAELEAKANVVEEFRQRWKAAERAEALRPSLEAERSAREAFTTLQERIQSQLRQAIRARNGAQALPQAVALLDLKAMPASGELSGATSALAARRAEVGALLHKAKDADSEQSKAREWAVQLHRMASSLAQTQATIETRQRERQAAIDACHQARTARDQLNGLQRAAEEAQRQAQAAAAIGPAECKEREAIAAQNRSEALLNSRTGALLELRQQQITGMAAQLAKGLVAGHPCPVCGATSHPAPTQSDGPSVGEGEINAAEQEVNAASHAAREAATAVAAARAERQALIEKAGPAATTPEAAQGVAREAIAALETARAIAKTVEALEQAITAHEQTLKQAAESQQATATQLALLQTAVKEANARAAALQAEIDQELGVGTHPRAVLEAFEPLEIALKELNSSCQDQGMALSRLEEASARLKQDLADSAFADGQAVEAALEEPALRQRMAERIQAYEKEVIQLRGVLSSAEFAELSEHPPDVAQAETALAAADAARLKALERLSEARGSQQDIARLAAEHRSVEEVAHRLQQDAELLKAVSDRCLGKASPYISLQRWVLSAYLEEICGYANQRLDLMTSGRYQLRLSDEGGRGGRQAGLGLRVLDAYTGEEREVNSLSGGETFQASLALALAVADAVEARSGGIHLEALFIDEGFGSLDPDNLQLAMDELDRLREGGRMIGIISHVGALKERIRAGIEVRATEQGSFVRTGTGSIR